MHFVFVSQFSIIVLVLGIIGSHLKVPFVQSLIVLRNLLREDLDASTHNRSYQLVLMITVNYKINKINLNTHIRNIGINDKLVWGSLDSFLLDYLMGKS